MFKLLINLKKKIKIIFPIFLAIIIFISVGPRLKCDNIYDGLKNTKDLNKFCKTKQIDYCIIDFFDNIFDYNMYFDSECINNND